MFYAKRCGVLQLRTNYVYWTKYFYTFLQFTQLPEWCCQKKMFFLVWCLLPKQSSKHLMTSLSSAAAAGGLRQPTRHWLKPDCKSRNAAPADVNPQWMSLSTSRDGVNVHYLWSMTILNAFVLIVGIKSNLLNSVCSYRKLIKEVISYKNNYFICDFLSLILSLRA